MEEENNNQIPFLDILISREANGQLQISLYRKRTHINKYLNFHSYQPMQHKVAVVKTLAHRPRKNCSEDFTINS